MKRNHQDKHRYGGADGCGNELSFSNFAGKSKLFEEEQRSDAGMDELLAVLGYKVKSSDMAEVAQKLEQLEMAMGTVQEDGISHVGFDTVHYNPSDLSSWVQSLLSEFNPADASSMSSNSDSRASIYNDHSDYDISAVVYKQPEICNKRIKTGSDCAASPPDPVAEVPAEPLNRPVLVDSQESGVRLVHTLVACAEAIQEGNAKIAEALVKNVGILAASQAGAMGKVAMYFAEALARRIYRYSPQDSLEFSSYSDLLQMHFYETCPYLKFAHFTANQAILEAFADADRVHVIDFSLKQGMQWPALMQALALRPGGPPAFRLTGIGPPQPNNTDALQQVGYKLAQFADTIGVEFEFRGFVTNSLADLDASILEIRPSSVESVAVNSVFELHRLLARPAAIDKVLNVIKAMKPKILTIVENEANHNGPVFLDRFNEALNYYSNMFDSLECSGISPSAVNDQLMSEMYLGRQIFNVVSYEGLDRVERHELLTQWRDRMDSAEFEPVHLGSNAFKQASTLLALYGGGDGYRVEENDGCLMLGWHTRPLIATSAWRIGGGDSK